MGSTAWHQRMGWARQIDGERFSPLSQDGFIPRLFQSIAVHLEPREVENL